MRDPIEDGIVPLRELTNNSLKNRGIVILADHTHTHSHTHTHTQNTKKQTDWNGTYKRWRFESFPTDEGMVPESEFVNKNLKRRKENIDYVGHPWKWKFQKPKTTISLAKICFPSPSLTNNSRRDPRFPIVSGIVPVSELVDKYLCRESGMGERRGHWGWTCLQFFQFFQVSNGGGDGSAQWIDGKFPESRFSKRNVLHLPPSTAYNRVFKLNKFPMESGICPVSELLLSFLQTKSAQISRGTSQLFLSHTLNPRQESYLQTDQHRVRCVTRDAVPCLRTRITVQPIGTLSPHRPVGCPIDVYQSWESRSDTFLPLSHSLSFSFPSEPVHSSTLSAPPLHSGSALTSLHPNWIKRRNSATDSPCRTIAREFFPFLNFAEDPNVAQKMRKFWMKMKKIYCFSTLFSLVLHHAMGDNWLVPRWSFFVSG